MNDRSPQVEHGALRRLVALDLPREHYALFGSGPLLVRGWLSDVGDLDVIARGPAWERAKELGRVSFVEAYGVEIVEVGDDITIGTEWGIGDVDVGALIDDAESLDGIPCVRLEHIIAYKRIADRPKDIDHLATIYEHQGSATRLGE